MSEAAPADGGQGAAATSSSAVLNSGAAPAAPAQPTSVQVTPAPTQPANPSISWLGDKVDEATLGYVANKGWDSPDKAVTSYQNLEKLLGADRAGNTVVLPKEGADPKEWAAVYDRLGRPTGPDGYKIDAGSLPKELVASTLAKYHELGLTKQQGEALASFEVQRATQAAQAAEQAKAVEFAKQDAAIKQEWGQAYTQNLAQAQAAARALNMDAATIDKLSDALGHAGTMKLLQQIGSRATEADFVAGENRTEFGNVMSPAQAKSEIKALAADRAFTAKLLAKSAAETARWTQLHQWAYPE